MVDAIFAGEEADLQGLIWKHTAMEWAGLIGLALLWIGAILTAVTGWDYTTKAVRLVAGGEGGR